MANDEQTPEYAEAMNEAIAAATRAEDERAAAQAELGRLNAQLARAIRERDAAREGETGDVDLRSYCESCNKLWHRDYVTWFQQPYMNDSGASCSSACGTCFDQVPVDHEPL